MGTDTRAHKGCGSVNATPGVCLVEMLARVQSASKACAWTLHVHKDYCSTLPLNFLLNPTRFTEYIVRPETTI